MSQLIKKGSKGDAVRDVQMRLAKLGFALDVDGDFGSSTDGAVRELQTLFGYTVDGIAGPGTIALMDAQIGYGWSRQSADAVAKAKASQVEGGAKTAAGSPKAVPEKQAIKK